VGFASHGRESAGTITNLAAETGDPGITLSQSVSGSYPYGNPGTTDQFYTFFGATGWTISGTASVAIDQLAFQIRMSPPASSSGATSTAFYSPLLNGVGATAQLTATGLDADPTALPRRASMSFNGTGRA